MKRIHPKSFIFGIVIGAIVPFFVDKVHELPSPELIRQNFLGGKVSIEKESAPTVQMIDVTGIVVRKERSVLVIRTQSDGDEQDKEIAVSEKTQYMLQKKNQDGSFAPEPSTFAVLNEGMSVSILRTEGSKNEAETVFFEE